ncbi:MAG: cytochrome C oxidase subunit IV family protein [Cyclobacteriaceae bacterium]|nr:cytochrome C oxidase subunit IV family protein [Cyclobacteriaceae bacterium]MCX7636502.1 cytochrome C oxidase subunit IV family protein [Cyclobacteriaceae bacterium]MDW8330534.1 cytochrome C oxidase subunit IV family protein [Cyclobacteriaceae bacterium]
MAYTEETPQIKVLPPDTAKIKKLWRVAGILALVTIAEFAVAFNIPHEYKDLRIWTFILMTIVKAGYIVGEFMHLRYEVKVLFWSILIPMIFVVWMLVAFVYEGISIFELRQW